jgi:hypothetical protein
MIVWMGAGGAEIIHNVAAGRGGAHGAGWVVYLDFHW